MAASIQALRALSALPAPPLEGLLRPLDRLRARLLRALPARSLVVPRERRVALAGSAMMVAAFLATSSLPLALLALGPLVWGVPHLVSDVRYLVARPGYHRRPWVMLPMAAGMLSAWLGLGVRGGLAGAAGTLLLARAPLRRRALGLVALGALIALAHRVGPLSDLAFAHLHNALGVGLWWAWRRRATRLHWLPLALFAAGVGLILAGASEPFFTRTGGLSASWTGLSAGPLAGSLSPVQAGPVAARFLVLYAFGQAAHYAVWLRLLPEDARPSATPRSYAQSWRALRVDVGGAVLWAALLGAVALAVWATRSVAGARSGYLEVAFFHGYLELGAAALLWAEMRPAEVARA